MWVAFAAIGAMAWAGWGGSVERTHAMYVSLKGKPLIAKPDGSAEPIEVWTLESPIFVDSQALPTRDKPIRLRASMDAMDAIDRLIGAHTPFDVEIHVYAEGSGKRIQRVVRLTGASILRQIRVAPGHGREGGLPNKPYIGLELICRTVKAGPPSEVKPTGGGTSHPRIPPKGA